MRVGARVRVRAMFRVGIRGRSRGKGKGRRGAFERSIHEREWLGVRVRVGAEGWGEDWG